MCICVYIYRQVRGYAYISVITNIRHGKNKSIEMLMVLIKRFTQMKILVHKTITPQGKVSGRRAEGNININKGSEASRNGINKQSSRAVHNYTA